MEGDADDDSSLKPADASLFGDLSSHMMKVISDAYCKQVSEQDVGVSLKGGPGGVAVDMNRVKAEIMEQVDDKIPVNTNSNIPSNTPSDTSHHTTPSDSSRSHAVRTTTRWKGRAWRARPS